MELFFLTSCGKCESELTRKMSDGIRTPVKIGDHEFAVLGCGLFL